MPAAAWETGRCLQEAALIQLSDTTHHSSSRKKRYPEVLGFLFAKPLSRMGTRRTKQAEHPLQMGHFRFKPPESGGDKCCHSRNLLPPTPDTSPPLTWNESMTATIMFSSSPLRRVSSGNWKSTKARQGSGKDTRVRPLKSSYPHSPGKTPPQFRLRHTHTFLFARGSITLPDPAAPRGLDQNQHHFPNTTWGWGGSS